MSRKQVSSFMISARSTPTHAVELIRFALYGQLEPTSAIVFVVTTAIFLTLAVYGYDPAKGLMARLTAD